MKKERGRPSIYTQDISDLICERLACGESMRSISRDDDMPCMSTLFKWLREIEEFREQYIIAKTESADAMVEEMLDIADHQVDKQPVIRDGEPVMLNGEMLMVKDNASINHARLRIDTRKWTASKLKPKKYGDKITQEHDVTGELALLLSEIDGRDKGLPGGFEN